MKTRLERIFERTVLDWPQVHHKEENGHVNYMVNAWTFAYFEDNLLVLTAYRLTLEERQELEEKYGAQPHGSRMHWAVPVSEASLPELLPYVRRVYEEDLKILAKLVPGKSLG